MTPIVRLIDRPAFTIAGRQTWITGPDNEQFGRFWQQCRAEGLFDVFHQIQHGSGAANSSGAVNGSGAVSGAQTGAAVLGVSRVEKDPANRAFYYMIAIEAPAGALAPAGADTTPESDLVFYPVPAARWAVFECRGKAPEAIVASEMYAFMEWLPNSGFRHAPAPEMEVYPASGEADYCEFWLPVE